MNTRRAKLLFVGLAVLALPALARAENVGIDVAVDVAGLDPAATKIGVACMVCTVDCEAAAGGQVLGTGATSVGVNSILQGYQGTVSVTVPTSSAKGSDYLCRLNIANASASFVAGTGPDWTLPDEEQPFTNMLKGKLPSSKAPVANKCKNGAEPINGKCPSSNVASAPAKTCPDGSAMPANGNCGFVGPSLDIPGILQIFTPCPNGQPRLANGQCPATTGTNAASNGKSSGNVLQPCPDGQARMKNGQCPGPKNIQRNDLFKLFQPAPANNGLH
ncbi:MAG TPA: hypothetical protein VHA70_15535 [Bauldia sp.]|nr:hypothetical protein [Bauldia sp.]